MPIDMDAIPPAGGRWIRDPETGALSPAPDEEQQPAPDAPSEE